MKTKIKLKSLLNDTENIENRLAWQQFSQSLVKLKIPVIDALENVELKLYKQLVQAKKRTSTKQRRFFK